MPLSKANHILSTLKEIDESITFARLECWTKKENDYNIYIFSIQLEDKSELLKVHEELRDYIAIYFQSQVLEKNVERWNIYQFFFIKDKIDEVTKQLVEQDKFSTRKIIHDGFNRELSDEEIISLIDVELFNFTVSKRSLASDSVDTFLKSKGHDEVILILDKKLTAEELIKTLNHE